MAGEVVAVSANAEVGQRVAGLRKAAGWTQGQLAERLSAVLGKPIEPLTVTRMEGDKRPIVVAELVALADVFGIKASELLPASTPREAALRQWQNIVDERARAVVVAVREYDEAKAKVRHLTDRAVS